METRMTRLIIMTCAGLLTTSAMARDEPLSLSGA